ncbi:TetR/AcrR family transcriptional regulator [Gordonia sp. NPDC127522]|uniref:TetR/AcrR family transcriptional regulator n=1 Tax=Gordonia sp. NPDC127522 TaxID=3345390 RepID=UPI003634B02F
MTKSRIIDGYAGLVGRYGLASVTLDDVLAQTSTSKSQLFHYFPNGKDDLMTAVAHRQSELVRETIRDRMPQLVTWDAWRQWREQLVSERDIKGDHCPLGVLVIDLHHASPGARALIAQATSQLAFEIETGIETMRKAGRIADTADPHTIALSLTAGIYGAGALHLATGSKADVAALIDTTMAHLGASTTDR